MRVGVLQRLGQRAGGGAGWRARHDRDKSGVLGWRLIKIAEQRSAIGRQSRGGQCGVIAAKFPALSSSTGMDGLLAVEIDERGWRMLCFPTGLNVADRVERA